MPVSSYAPELIETFKLANRQIYTIKLGNRAAAIKLRARFHNLRRDMRKENHALTHIANGVTFSIVNGDLVIGPADMTFVNALRSAGITIKTPSAGSPPEQGPSSAPAPGPADGGSLTGEVLDTFFQRSPEGERKDGTDNGSLEPNDF